MHKREAAGGQTKKQPRIILNFYVISQFNFHAIKRGCRKNVLLLHYPGGALPDPHPGKRGPAIGTAGVVRDKKDVPGQYRLGQEMWRQASIRERKQREGGVFRQVRSAGDAWSYPYNGFAGESVFIIP
jgi:hypothetical protein